MNTITQSDMVRNIDYVTKALTIEYTQTQIWSCGFKELRLTL